MLKRPADLEHWTDEALVERALRRGAGDDRPFTLLFNRHKQLVWRVCYRFTENSADAEDLLQEVFFKAYRSLKTFQGRSAFRTWLYQIAVNTCRNELRSRQRRPQYVDAHIDDLELGDAAAPEPGQRTFEHVAAALLLLQEHEREILVMRDIEELPYNQIAETLGIKLSAAKMRVQRARLALARLLQQQGSPKGRA